MTSDPISPWFVAAEQLGEFIGIRFGRVPPGQAEPEWFFLRHTDFDGIGGLAERPFQPALIVMNGKAHWATGPVSHGPRGHQLRGAGGFARVPSNS